MSSLKQSGATCRWTVGEPFAQPQLDTGCADCSDPRTIEPRLAALPLVIARQVMAATTITAGLGIIGWAM